MNLIHTVQKIVAPIHRRVRLMIARAVLKLVDETKTFQTIQVSIRDELRDDAERFQNYGVSSFPAVGAEALVVMVGGSADHSVVVAVDDRRYRPKTLIEGEVCVYTLANGIRILCKADGLVQLGTSPTDFVALATNTEDRLTALENFAAAHTHPIAGIMPGPSAAVAAPASGAPTSTGDVAATEVMAK